MINFTLIVIFILLTFKTLFTDELYLGYKALEDGDYSKALYYLSFYAENGNPRAQYNLGLMYNKGKGVSIDHKEANKWFIMSASQGNMLAQYSLALNYLNGFGVELNYSNALDFFKMAAYQGLPSSQVNVGNMYYLGQGTKINFPRAHMWWKIANDKNIFGAKKNITMIEDKMSAAELLEAKNLYIKCMQTTLPKC